MPGFQGFRWNVEQLRVTLIHGGVSMPEWAIGVFANIQKTRLFYDGIYNFRLYRFVRSCPTAS